MSRYPLYLCLSAVACFVASSSLATPIRIMLASTADASTPTQTADIDDLEQNNLQLVPSLTAGTGAEGNLATVDSLASARRGGDRNSNLMMTSQPQMGGVALFLNSVADDGSSGSGGSVSTAAVAGQTGSGGDTGTGEETGELPDPPAHMPEPGAAILFALGAWVTGRRFRR